MFPKEIALTKATEFIEALSLTDKKWAMGNRWDSPWIFRGQSDASKPLIPSAWRSASTEAKTSETINFIQHHKDYAWNYVRGQLKDAVSAHWQGHEPELNNHELEKRWQNTVEVLHQAYAEILSINEFIKLADSVGHTTNSDYLDQITPKYLSDIALGGNENSKIWMTNDIIALAQHHGIPTRLLDWTSQPRIAAFFAAEKIDFDTAPSDSKIAVYAFQTIFEHDRIKIRRIPRSKSTYLHAQSGLFTYDSGGDAWYIQNGSWPSFEEIFSNETDFARHLVKFTLPVSQAGNLLRLLWREGISRAHLMPTLDNVALALKKQMYWSETLNPSSVPKWE